MNQRQTINLLNDHVSLLKNEKKLIHTPFNESENFKTKSDSAKVNDKPSTNLPTQSNVSTSDIEKIGDINKLTAVSKIPEALDMDTTPTVINISPVNIPDTQIRSYANVAKRKYVKSIIGNLNSATALKAAPKLFSLHVYRLDPKTEVDNVKEHLITTFPEIQVEKLNSSSPEDILPLKPLFMTTRRQKC